MSGGLLSQHKLLDSLGGFGAHVACPASHQPCGDIDLGVEGALFHLLLNGLLLSLPQETRPSSAPRAPATNCYAEKMHRFPPWGTALALASCRCVAVAPEHAIHPCARSTSGTAASLRHAGSCRGKGWSATGATRRMRCWSHSAQRCDCGDGTGSRVASLELTAGEKVQFAISSSIIRFLMSSWRYLIS